LSLPVDPNALPQDAETLKKMSVDVTAQLDRTERLLRQLLQAKTGRRSEQLSREQLALFATELGITLPETEDSADDHDQDPPARAPRARIRVPPRGRKPLPRHLKRERIEHDLPEQEKRCADCNQDLRKIGDEVSERYEYLPAQMKVIEDACFTYACACTVRTASKPPQPIEKSTAGCIASCAGDREQAGRSLASAPAGQDVSAARHRDRRANHVRLDGAVRRAPPSFIYMSG
jgi:transposase